MTNELRLKAGIIIVIIQTLVRYVVPIFVFEFTPFAAFAGLLGWLAVLIWWSFFSRASGTERWLAPLAMVASLGLTLPLLHHSIGQAMNGIIFFMYATPPLSIALVLWVIISRNLDASPRRVSMIATIAVASLAWNLVRFDGMQFAEGAEFAWRWTETAEEPFLAQKSGVSGSTMPGQDDVEVKWSGFRGPERKGIVTGTQIDTDWAASPPRELWRRQIGPGWSSFSVRGDLIYTQEQHGEEEVVACYNFSTGEPVWEHRDRTRFWEAIGGPGPRPTPSIHNGRIYTFGATGILNALDAIDGSVIWSKNVAAELQATVPTWGFSSSPLIVDNLVVVAVPATLAAYHVDSGKQAWTGPADKDGYSSPQLVQKDENTEILIMSSTGITSVSPDGSKLWKHNWEGDGIVQPTLTRDGDILLGARAQSARMSVSRQGEGYTIEEKWTSNRLKPYFNDLVIHNGHAFGFDGRIRASIDIKTGERNWKGGRYGAGQMVLLRDQDLLLVVSEKGEIALVSATPEKYTEQARMPAVSGKTWNHPVVVDGVLLVRNGEEMAAFRLTRETS